MTIEAPISKAEPGSSGADGLRGDGLRGDELRGDGLRLASVVAIDVAGYSKLAEQDQKAAARVIMTIRTAAETIAARHQGRIFNTAGDGLMLEFPAAERALSAIVDFIDHPVHDVSPIRIGAHLGDVYVAHNGDLLGHGVNVSSRLQAVATPGTALVSADLCSAIQGDRRQRLKRKGRVSLPKMRDRVAVFEIVPLPKSKPGAPVAAPPAPELSPPRKRRVPFWAFVALAAAVAIASPNHRAVIKHVQAELSNAPPLIAVLPFDNLSDAPNSQYLADGISEEILDAIARDSGLKVAARTSSFAFRGAKKAEAGAALRADYVLDGSVRRDGDKLRITAYLNDVRHGGTAWTQSYDRTLSQTLALEDEIAGEVARALRVVLVSPPPSLKISGLSKRIREQVAADLERSNLKSAARAVREAQDAVEADDDADEDAAPDGAASKRSGVPSAPSASSASDEDTDDDAAGAAKPTGALPAPPAQAAAVDPAAYELYLRGVQAYQDPSDASNVQAVQYFKQAIEKAPNFSRAWSALALAQAMGAPSARQSKDWKRFWDEAKASAAKALALDPKSGDALMALAALEHDWRKKASYIQAGMSVAPNNAAVAASWGRFLAAAGYEREAVPVLRRAVELDPLNPYTIANLVNALAATGDLDGANQVLADGFKRLPMSVLLWRRKFYLALFAKDYAEVDRILSSETIRPDSYSDSGSYPYLTNDRLLYRAYRSGKPADIQADLQAEEAAARDGDAENLVWRMAVLGQNGTALAMEDRYYPSNLVFPSKKGTMSIVPDHSLPIYLHPAVAGFRQDPRFMRLWDKERLTDYWRENNKWPDFCTDPKLGYDCKAEADKLFAARPSGA